MKQMFVKAFAADAVPSEPTFTWDTDGIPFIVDNSATAIISNVRRLFTGPLQPRSVTVETYQGQTTKTALVGSLRLVLTDDSGSNHEYVIPESVYDPDTPMNILGVPALGKFFGDNADASDITASDGTTIKSGGTRSHLV